MKQYTMTVEIKAKNYFGIVQGLLRAVESTVLFKEQITEEDGLDYTTKDTVSETRIVYPQVPEDIVE